jgi:hypothetical protein
MSMVAATTIAIAPPDDNRQPPSRPPHQPPTRQPSQQQPPQPQQHQPPHYQPLQRQPSTHADQAAPMAYTSSSSTSMVQPPIFPMSAMNPPHSPNRPMGPPPTSAANVTTSHVNVARSSTDSPHGPPPPRPPKDPSAIAMLYTPSHSSPQPPVMHHHHQQQPSPQTTPLRSASVSASASPMGMSADATSKRQSIAVDGKARLDDEMAEVLSEQDRLMPLAFHTIQSDPRYRRLVQKYQPGVCSCGPLRHCQFRSCSTLY